MPKSNFKSKNLNTLKFVYLLFCCIFAITISFSKKELWELTNNFKNILQESTNFYYVCSKGHVYCSSKHIF